MNCRLVGPRNISLNPGYFLFDGELKVKGCAPVWVWVVVLALWGQLKSNFILGCRLSYLSQCRAPGCSCCCKTNQLVQSHFFPVAAPHACGIPGWEPCSKGWGVQVGWDAGLVLELFLLLAVWELCVGLCREGLPPPRSAVLLGQTLAAAQSCVRTAIKSVSSVIWAVGQQSPASTVALPHASTTCGKLFNHIDTDLISGHVWMTEKCASTPSHWAPALQISLPLHFILVLVFE